MKNYRIIGLSSESGNVVTVDVRADGPYSAMSEVAEGFVNVGLGLDVVILGAVEATSGSAIKFVLPGDDNDRAAYAKDMVGLID